VTTFPRECSCARVTLAAQCNSHSLLKGIKLCDNRTSSYHKYNGRQLASKAMSGVSLNTRRYNTRNPKPQNKGPKKKTLEEYRLTLEEEVRRYLQSCLAPPCRDLCRDMQEKLPLEIRELVYEHLFETPECGTSITRISYVKEFREFEAYIARDIRTPAADWPPFGDVHHIANLDYMCTTTLSELLRTYLKVKSFVFYDHIKSCRPILNAFLFNSTRAAGIGLEPAKLVGKIEIRIYDYDLRDRPESICENLALFHRLGRMASINLFVKWLCHGNIGTHKLAELASQVFPALEDLHSGGHTVTINIDWTHSSWSCVRQGYRPCNKAHRVILSNGEFSGELLQRLLLTQNW
jgi:hypothetical protein